MTRLKLPFSDVSSIIELTSDRIPVSDNIVYAVGETRAEKYNNARQILSSQNEVNAVIIIEPKREGLDKVIKELNTFAEGKRLRAEYSPAAPSDSDTCQSLKNYLTRRNLNLRNPLLDGVEISDLTSATTAIWNNAVKDTLSMERTSLLHSIMTYAPNYSGDRLNPDAYINAHIDAANSAGDIRIVECMKGSGTLVFDDTDFEIYDNSKVELIRSNITCWSLMEGSAIAIRMPSHKNIDFGAKPTVHAHGIGQADDTPEERLTVRHDLTLE